MANFKYRTNLDASDFLLFRENEKSGRASAIGSSRDATSDYKTTYHGSFERGVYDYYLKNNNGVSGTMTSVNVEKGGETLLTVSDLDFNFMFFNAAGTLLGAERALALLMEGDDSVQGSARNDNIRGYEGNDVLRGKSGSDSISGGNGNDLISGGAGADKLSGGDGADTFIFARTSESNASKGMDRITDFSTEDMIDLRGIDARTDRGGNGSFKFIGDDDFSGRAGELRSENGVVQADTDGDGKANLYFKVDFASASHADLNSGDFLL